MAKIEDGQGTGKLARVNGNNEMKINGTVTDDEKSATKTGRSYNLNTGVITLTDADDTPIMYVKNNEDVDLVITAIAIGIGPSTGGSGGIPKITIVRNPTVGTTIDNANAIDVNSNRNYGSPKTLTVDAYKGATGETMTDGTDHLIFFQPSNGRLFATIDEVLQKGNSIGVKFDPQASNTSQDVYAALICHLKDANE